MPVVADGLAQVPAGANLKAVGVIDGGHHPAPHLTVQILSWAVGRCGVLFLGSKAHPLHVHPCQ